MGLHIIIVDADNRPMDRTGPRLWDSARHSGDREFVAADLGWTRHEVGDPLDGECVVRPDTEKARAWIRDSALVEGNKERLFALVDILDTHPEWWLFMSV